MKRTYLNRIGRKTKEWFEARKELLVKLKQEGYDIKGNYIYGHCVDCGSYRLLDPDHLIKRSRGGGHTRENIGLPCRECHDRRDNQGDPMNKKPTNKKADWGKTHKCISCGRQTSLYLCHWCNKKSVK